MVRFLNTKEQAVMEAAAAAAAAAAKKETVCLADVAERPKKAEKKVAQMKGIERGAKGKKRERQQKTKALKPISKRKRRRKKYEKGLLEGRINSWTRAYMA